MDNRLRVLDGRKLLTLQRERGLSQQGLAKLCGVGQRSISRYISQGETAVLSTTIERIADSLNVSFNELLASSDLVSFTESSFAGHRVSMLPPYPFHSVGRFLELQYLKQRLGISKESTKAKLNPITVVRGWPGIGKSTLMARLAHDPSVTERFPDGVLFVALGQTPLLLQELSAWARVVAPDGFTGATLEQARSHLTAKLQGRKLLLLIDDAWNESHVQAFRVGSEGSALVVSTRLTRLADTIAPNPADVYVVPPMNPSEAMELFASLAPTIARNNPEESADLVEFVERLPLAIQVAGRLLNKHQQRGWGISALMSELGQDARRLLSEQAPADMAQLAQETSPNVAALLYRSVAFLDDKTRERFAYLGGFATKPATFDLEALALVWEVESPKPIVDRLIDHGLVEFVSNRRYQIHALLATLASTLCNEEATAAHANALRTTVSPGKSLPFDPSAAQRDVQPRRKKRNPRA